MTQFVTHASTTNSSRSTAAGCVFSRSQLVTSSCDVSRGRRPPVPGQESSDEMTEERSVVMATNSSAAGRCSTPPGQLIVSRNQNYDVVGKNASPRTAQSTSGTPRKSTTVNTSFGKHRRDSHRRLLSDDDRQTAPLGFEPEGCCDSVVHPEVNRDDAIDATRSIETDELERNGCDRVTNDDISVTSHGWASSLPDSFRCHDVNIQPEMQQATYVIEEGNREIELLYGGHGNATDSRKQASWIDDHVIATIHSMDDRRCHNDSNEASLVERSLIVSRDLEGATTQPGAFTVETNASHSVPDTYCSSLSFWNALDRIRTKSSSCSSSTNDNLERLAAKDAQISVRPLQENHVSLPRSLRLGSLSTVNNNRNLAEVDPERFVAILWDKLKGGVVNATSRRTQQPTANCSNIENDEETASTTTDQPHHRNLSTNGVLGHGGEHDGSSTLSSLRSLVTAASSGPLQPDTEDACAEAILENHFRRVWDADDEVVIARSGNDVGVFAQPLRARSRVSPPPLPSSTSAPFSKSRVCDTGVIAGIAGSEAQWNNSLWRRRSTAINDPVSCSTSANQSASSVSETASMTVRRRLSVQQQHAVMSSSYTVDCCSCRVGTESPLFQRSDDCPRIGTRWSTSATILPRRTTDCRGNSDVDDENGSSDCSSSTKGRFFDRRVSKADVTSGRAHSSSDISATYVPADSDATAALHDAVRRLERSSIASRLEEQIASCHGWSPSLICCPLDDTSSAVVQQRCRRHQSCRCRKTIDDARDWCGSLSDDSPRCPQDRSSSLDYRWCCRPGGTREDFLRSQSTCCSVVQDTSFHGSRSVIFDGCQGSTIVRPTARPTMSSTATCLGTEVLAVHDAGAVTVVGYYIGDESIPYRTTVAGQRLTLAHFKRLLSKKGDFRYFFKTPSDEFDSDAVMEEIFDDDAILPLWEGKILGKVEPKQ